MKLVIVESPTKAKTITRFLGKNFKVLASYGHVRDLPKSKLGVDVEHGFEPTYTIPVKSKTKVKELKDAAKKAETILFATDEDREGEAISWHLAQILDVDPSKLKRLTFHEITEEAIKESLEHPRDLDLRLVDAQQARRVLDRLVGYELSPLLWRKIQRGLSAGRVQSPALRLIVEREREIKAFVAEEYWTIEGEFKKTGDGATFDAKLNNWKGKALDKMGITSKKDADAILDAIKKASWKVSAVTEKEKKASPPPPFTTSTLQQAANTRLGFTSKQTMTIAQHLYEGIELGTKGQVGLITYMRTDSVSLSDKFTGDARSFLTKEYGDRYALPEPRRYKTKSKGAQEAHESIRPTEASRTPDDVAAYLDPGELKLYKLIWQRAVATQMPEAKLLGTSVDILEGDPSTSLGTGAVFRATGQRVTSDGYLKLYPDQDKEKVLPELKQDEKVEAVSIDGKQHFTEPPPRYSDATLVKTLEEDGIGRPSTYASIIGTLIERGYVERDERKRLYPTPVAFDVNDLLVKHFPDIVDLEFTARLEASLDKIAEGEMQWRPLLEAFYGPFHANLTSKEQEMTKEAEAEASGEVCDKCGKPMAVKRGRFGKFLACTGYPECKNTKPMKGDAPRPEPEPTDEKCPTCGAPMVKKVGRFGPFLSCSRYPECKTIKNIEKSTGITCPKCNKGTIIEKRTKKGKTFFSCNRYPDCDQAFWDPPTEEKCPNDSWPLLKKKTKLYCAKEGCGFSKPREETIE
ncbi:DNA topoisomerase I [Candidatus Uhrbacteria bacterium RIFCSPHIGHO2_12_FULL_60_25]|uniref:DNA topoisomerase 1 n=1 Tax=Candidatus Uhrbacteria bacterium RIFCSPHIGHO2_12_FULL_60_25 TaxID=1802399 RepID=A0A1F7UM46_9BACT|nr:MAG: DNA topoisomerase I [Candidatus Uhrbacteria bacterium RIFCSPHIGHO2_02_FULL_60_44]OGL79332.1 MAG: DNA topoisomerase I [Candidatus Uhrbacteria bacterium RIFCSPHIGHO2_12_FULL_60_25]